MISNANTVRSEYSNDVKPSGPVRKSKNCDSDYDYDYDSLSEMVF